MADASDSAEWVLELIDKVTKPARAAGKAIVDLTKKLRLAERAAIFASRSYTQFGTAMRRGLIYSAEKAEFAVRRLAATVRDAGLAERVSARFTAMASLARQKSAAASLAAYKAVARGTNWAAAGYGAAASYAANKWSTLGPMAAGAMGRARGMAGASGQWLSARMGPVGQRAMEWARPKMAAASAAMGSVGKRFVGAGKAGGAGFFQTAHHIEGLMLAYSGAKSLLSGDFFAKMAAGLDRVAQKWNQVLSIAKIASVAALGAAAALTKKVVDAAVFADSSRRTLGNLAGGQAGGEEAFQKSIQLSRELGLGVHSTVEQFKHLLAMQFKIGEAEELVKLAADLRDVTGDAAAAERALNAMTQIKAKGKLQAQELTLQLSNAGLSTMLVYQALSKRLNTDVAGVQKLMGQGKIDADTGLAAIKEAIMTKLHESAPGEAAKGYVENTITGLMDRLTHAPELLWVRVAESMKENFEIVKPVLQGILRMFDEINVGSIRQIALVTLDLAYKGVAMAKAFFEGFMNGLPGITAALRLVDVGTNALPLGRKLGELFAWLLSLALRFMYAMVRTFVWINDNRWIIYLWLGAKAFGIMWRTSVFLYQTLLAVRAVMWVISLFTAGGAAAGMGTAAASAARWLGGLVQIKATLMTIGRLIWANFIVGPAIAFGWLLAIGAALVLIVVYWEEICDLITDVLGLIKNSAIALWDSFVDVLKLIASGEIWSAAGLVAGKAFGKALLRAMWDMMWFMPGMQPIKLTEYIGMKMGWWDNWVGKPTSLGSDFKKPPQPSASSANYVDSQFGIAYGEQLKELAAIREAVEAQHNNPAANMHVEVNVDAKGKDAHEVGEETAAQIEQRVRAVFKTVAVNFGGA